MAITYVLPEIPARSINRPRPDALGGTTTFAADESPRKLTPYPDASQKFPLSEEDEAHSRAIEIDFTPLPSALRRSPTAPSRQVEDHSPKMRRASLPSLVASSVESMAAAVGKRRRGWLIPQNIVEGLRDLKSLASSSSSERDDRRYPKENPDDERFRRRAAATSFDGTSLASDPYTACDLAAVKTGSFYSQSSTSLAYFLSEKSVIDYFELEPVVVKAKRGRFSKACRFLLSGRKKKTMESQHLGVQAA